MIIRHGAAGAIRLGGCSGRKRDLMTATVLLVEDERKLRELLRSYLERAGFMVLSTGSGAEAISLVSSAAPDLVVLDLGLPDMPGETVAQEVRAAGATPILVLTAKSAEEDRIAGLELGADDSTRVDFTVHRNGDIGSPRTSGSTSASSAGRRPGSRSAALGPPPGRRTRPSGSSPASSSATPRETLPSRIPAARATTRMPPCPSARASAPATSRRYRSSRCGNSTPELPGKRLLHLHRNAHTTGT